ncbi:uncharacterized protein B0I36DRAFT_344782 [Microdochium trichocladiopsis]|uniref:DUF7582 domain-containing protein n=1 Tax=Microdochium trichocladiopsis TaxID=1682393 RepID=A0A9P8YLE7_9PEZI|nr:uncharacterized protein B0I36DRAFT_344782 [Microdochium trichocladiopsis]KAH7041154.1 hypothetical protein B0I36DRAFT_344782 [Microdochium trichocladiopsis]
MAPSSSALRLRISSPLEAGTSILDTQHSLPAHLTDALEYASKRLARKALHLTLVVVRKDYQLPQNQHYPSSLSSASVPPTPTSPPSSAGSLASPLRSPIAGLRSLVRKGTHASLASLYSTTSSTSATATDALQDGYLASAVSSPMFSPRSEASYDTPLSPGRRGVWPPTPGSMLSMSYFHNGTASPPMTPHTPGSMISSMSSATDPASIRALAASNNNNGATTAGGPGLRPTGEFGIRLVYTTPLSYKDDKLVRTVLEKASRKFHLDANGNGGGGGTPGALPLAAMTAAACGLNADLIRRSIIQNEVLFCSEGLTLLGLDRLYTFKSALACYARAVSAASMGGGGGVGGDGSAALKAAAQTRIEETVDELRRLVLGGDGSSGSGSAGGYFGFSPGRQRQVPRSDLHRSYDWIRVSPSALAAVERMYKRAYGGPAQVGAFEPSPAEEEERERERREREQEEQDRREHQEALMRRRMVKIGTPPPGRATPVAGRATPMAGRTTSPPLKISTVDLGNNTLLKPTLIRPTPVSSPPLSIMTAQSPQQRDSPASISPVHESPEQEQRQRQPQLSPRRLNGKTPKLTLQTAAAIEIKIEKVKTEGEDEAKDGDDESEHGDRTARPFHGMPFWSNIDELLSPVDGKGERRKSDKLGPMTPNGYDDISPITRGEWGFLFSREGTWNENRTAPVETW